MPSLIDMRRRVRAVKSTQQITKAMKMVAASKLRRAQEKVVATRPYAREARRVLESIAGRVDSTSHPLLTRRPGAEKGATLVIVITADRGLCGLRGLRVRVDDGPERGRRRRERRDRPDHRRLQVPKRLEVDVESAVPSRRLEDDRGNAGAEETAQRRHEAVTRDRLEPRGDGNHGRSDPHFVGKRWIGVPREQRIHLFLDELRHLVHAEPDESLRFQATFDRDGGRLLKVLIEHANRVLSREQLLALKGVQGNVLDRAIDLKISRLRSKFGEAGAQLIRTVRGEGYVLAAAVTTE